MAAEAEARAVAAKAQIAVAQPATSNTTLGLVAGSRVTVNYKGGDRAFPGTVADENADGTYAIDYDDGDSEDSVCAAWVRPLALEAGCRASVSDNTGVTKTGTVVARTGNLSAAVTFDDGQMHASVPTNLLQPDKEGWHSPLGHAGQAPVAPGSPVIVCAKPESPSPVSVAAMPTATPPPLMAPHKPACASAAAAPGGQGSPGTRAKLFAWHDAADGEPAQWSPRGVGELRLERGAGGRPHFVLRSQATCKILFNAPLFQGMPAARAGPREVQLLCANYLLDAKTDVLTPEGGSAAPRKWLIRVPNGGVAEELVAAVQQHSAPSSTLQ